MAAYKMAAVKVTPPNDFPLGLIRSHVVAIHLFLMLEKQACIYVWRAECRRKVT
jgi:hypothetical protein